MTEHKSSLFVLISIVVIYWQVLCAVGLLWKAAPDEVVNVQQGSNITLRWHYEMEDNESFFCSGLASDPAHPFATRHKEESRYHYFSDKKQTKFVISGKNDVNLTVFSAELGSSNSGYCCIVKWDSNKTIMRDKRCTTIYIYDPPRITSHTPQLYCKQGDLVKLQCNATGYPEPRIRWIYSDTNKTIGNSSVTSLNITGKRSEGSYCCDVKNPFGRQIACTTVKVKVKVTTQRNCTSDSNKEIITKEKKLPLILGISCGILIAICLTVAVFIYLMKRKGITCQDKKPTDGDPHAVPLDTVIPSEEVLLTKRGTLPDDGYSNPEKLGFPNTIKSQRPQKEESQYETLLA